MKVIDEALLDEFRGPGKCQWCNRYWRKLEPHHIFSRGMGGGGRLDVRVNLIALDFECHQAVHMGLVQRHDLLAVVAAREDTTQDRIVEEIRRLRRLPKE